MSTLPSRIDQEWGATRVYHPTPQQQKLLDILLPRSIVRFENPEATVLDAEKSYFSSMTGRFEKLPVPNKQPYAVMGVAFTPQRTEATLVEWQDYKRYITRAYQSGRPGEYWPQEMEERITISFAGNDDGAAAKPIIMHKPFEGIPMNGGNIVGQPVPGARNDQIKYALLYLARVGEEPPSFRVKAWGSQPDTIFFDYDPARHCLVPARAQTAATPA